MRKMKIEARDENFKDFEIFYLNFILRNFKAFKKTF